MPLVFPATGNPQIKRREAEEFRKFIVRIIGYGVTLKWMQLCLPVL